MAHRWTREELADLRAMFPTTTAANMAAILNERYGHNRTVAGIYTIVSELGIQKKQMPFWTADRLEFMREYVPGHSEGEIAYAFERRFGIRLTRQQVKTGKARAGVKSGTVGGRFVKGQESWNKGLTWDDFMSPESQDHSRRTQFKKGNIPYNAIGKPIGYERTDADGYTWVKIALSKSHPGCNDNWRPKHHIEWEKANGQPVPDGCNIVFANHDKTDYSHENLVAVPRSIWSIIVRNGFAYNDAASLTACMNLARLKTCIYDATLAPRACKRCGEEFAPRYPSQRTCDTCLGRERK